MKQNCIWKDQKFEGKKLELETQMKELERRHQLREREREEELKWQITASEKDDILSQSTKAREKSLFNWVPKKRDVLDLANTISKTKTTIQTKKAA